MKTIKILKHLSRIMGQVAAQGLTLHMPRFYKEYSDFSRTDKKTLDCGTPACVAGYALLDSELREMIGIDTALEDSYETHSMDARSLIAKLPPNISGSIFGSYRKYRYRHAKELGYDMDLDTSKHLTAIHPTAADAKEWIDTIIKFGE